MEVVRDRLDRHGDLCEGVPKTKQHLGPSCERSRADAM
jgi:hypothetical protein